MNRVAMALGLALFGLACSGEISPNIVITQTDWQTPANEGDMESRQVDLDGWTVLAKDNWDPRLNAPNINGWFRTGLAP